MYPFIKEQNPLNEVRSRGFKEEMQSFKERPEILKNSGILGMEKSKSN